MRKIILIALLIAGFTQAFAGEIKYATASIPEALLKNAHVIKRYEEQSFELISTNETVLRKKYALTILDAQGEEAAEFVEHYDQLRQIKSIEGNLYDKNGLLLKKLKSKEIQDQSVSSNNLIEDSRIKVHNFNYKEYPYTVEYEVEIRFNHSFYFEGWMPQDDEDMAVQESKFTVISPANYYVRYKAINYTGEPATSTINGKKVISWQIQNIPAFKTQYASLWQDVITSVQIAPSEFSIQGYKGVMSSWDEFAKFQYSLNKGRDVLPEAIVQKVAQLTAGIKDEKEKIYTLYNYLQQNTRYISIQLGIGGWQPFEASYVAQKGYGDCKALSNYMYSLLKAAGIKSNYAIVRAGDGASSKRLFDEFPSNQFNHVVVCVPLQKDTVWLECTSQTETPGYMGSFTGNRKAFIIDENGGKLVATPRYGLNENTQTRSVKGVIDETGNLSAKVNTKFKAEQQDDLHGMINALSKERVKKMLNESMGLSTYEVNDFKYTENKSLLPEIHEYIDVTVSNFATITGKRIFLTPNIFNKTNSRFTVEEDRKADFVFDMAYRDVDTVELEIPAGYVPESLPKDVKISNRFGNYESVFKILGNQVVYIRKREHFAGRFPAKDQAELAQFFEAVYKADRSKIVLVKKEG